MGEVAFCAGQASGAAISGDRLILGKGDGAHEVQILLRFCNGNDAVPDAGDHGVLLLCGQV